MKKIIFIILGMFLFSGLLFAAAPSPTSSEVFNVTMKLPNPYYGLIVADRIVTTNLGAPGQFLKIGSNGFEWATVSTGDGGEGVEYIASHPIKIGGNILYGDNEIWLAEGGINAYHIGEGQVAYWNLATNSVTSSKIIDDAITTSKIATNAVTQSKLSSNSVTTDKISSGAVTKDKIAVKSVDHTRLDVYPLGHCPLDNAQLVYKNASGNLPNRLEWTNSAVCGSNTFSVGPVSSNRTVSYYSAPFNNCPLSVVHTSLPTNCQGSECNEEWNLNRSGGSYTNAQTVNNLANSTRTHSFSASDNDLYNSSYTIKYRLSQSSTGLTDDVSRNFTALSTNGCAPIVPTLNVTSYTHPNNQCITHFTVSNTSSCVGNCSYKLYLNNIEYTTGTFSGADQTITHNIYASDITSSNPKVKIKITNLGPNGISGLNNTSAESTLPIIIPQMYDGFYCAQ